MVWVTLKPSESLTIEELRGFCNGELAHYKIPRYLHLCDEFPVTVTGMVRKVDMRERSVAILGLGWGLRNAAGTGRARNHE